MMLDVVCPAPVLALLRKSYKGLEIRHALPEADLERYLEAVDIILAYVNYAANRSIKYIELKENGYIVVVYKHAPSGVYRIVNVEESSEECPCDL